MNNPKSTKSGQKTSNTRWVTVSDDEDQRRTTHARPWFLVQEPAIRRAILLGIAAILVWRGVWLLADLFIFPDNLPLSGVTTIAVGLIIFALFGEVRL